MVLLKALCSVCPKFSTFAWKLFGVSQLFDESSVREIRLNWYISNLLFQRLTKKQKIGAKMPNYFSSF